MSSDTRNSLLRQNRVLASLADRTLDQLAPHLETVPLVPRNVLCEAGERLEFVHFPLAGVVCLMASLREGIAETAAVGAEGFIGLECALGGDSALSRALVQLPGSAVRMPLEALRALAARHEDVRHVLLRYVRFFVIQALQSVACNSLHSVDERCAKWLLTAHDRSGLAQSFPLTQEFLAEMLGVHRPSVTIAARTLQRAGLIRYSRGIIVITDREGLEEAACECYGVIRRALDEILPAH